MSDDVTINIVVNNSSAIASCAELSAALDMVAKSAENARASLAFFSPKPTEIDWNAVADVARSCAVGAVRNAIRRAGGIENFTR